MLKRTREKNRGNDSDFYDKDLKKILKEKSKLQKISYYRSEYINEQRINC